jgi:plastocyanin
MNTHTKQNFLFVFFTLSILVLSISSSPLTLSSHVFASSDKDNASDSGKDHGKGHDDGGSDGGSSDGGSDGGSSDANSQSNINTETENHQFNIDNKEQKIASQVANQTVDDKYGRKVFYILIKSANNETSFVPDKVTLTTGSTIVWLNQDSSDHTITLNAEPNSKYALLNTLILPDGMVDQKFQSAGKYSFSDLDNPNSKGDITILDNSEKDGATSVALEE